MPRLTIPTSGTVQQIIPPPETPVGWGGYWRSVSKLNTDLNTLKILGGYNTLRVQNNMGMQMTYPYDSIGAAVLDAAASWCRSNNFLLIWDFNHWYTNDSTSPYYSTAPVTPELTAEYVGYANQATDIAKGLVAQYPGLRMMLEPVNETWGTGARTLIDTLFKAMRTRGWTGEVLATSSLHGPGASLNPYSDPDYYLGIHKYAMLGYTYTDSYGVVYPDHYSGESVEAFSARRPDIQNLINRTFYETDDTRLLAYARAQGVRTISTEIGPHWTTSVTGNNYTPASMAYMILAFRKFIELDHGVTFFRTGELADMAAQRNLCQSLFSIKFEPW